MKIPNNRFAKNEFPLQGFTLIELMIVVAIIGIASSIGIPSFVQFLNEQKLTAQSNDMVASLNLARSTSVKLRRTITIKKLTYWNNGWIIFIDNNGDGNQDVGETELKTYPALAQGSVTIASTNFANYISYSPNGRGNNLGDFTFCPPNNVDSSRKIVIAGSGRMHTEADNYAANCS